MDLSPDRTIAAVASPPGAAWRGIIRLSGPDAVPITGQLTDAPPANSGPPTRCHRRLMLRKLTAPLPADIQVWPGTRSYTGQPMTEIHMLGSEPLLELVLEDLYRAGAYPAERGEFTMRAFLAGRIDLLQAEAVAGVIDAADHAELKSALAQLNGGLTQRLQDARTTLIAVLGDLEAGLDFVEEDIRFISSEEICRRLKQIRQTVDDLIQEADCRLPSGHRPRIVLAGLPNAGKSTLFNCLAGTSLAIESSQPGTTTDYLSCPVRFGQIVGEVIDTAGLAEFGQTHHSVEQSAQTLARQQHAAADLILWCSRADLPNSSRQTDDRACGDAGASGTTLLKIRTCGDLVPDTACSDDMITVSVRTGHGLDQLRSAIEAAIRTTASVRSGLLATTAVRCRDSLRRTGMALDAAIESVRTEAGDEITAIGLRDALHELRVILGETWTDDILDHIFSNFCIGK